jgi:hypothetical protein
MNGRVLYAEFGGDMGIAKAIKALILQQGLG